MTGGNDLPPAPAGVLKKGPWTTAEDAVLVEYVRKHGEGNWNALQRNTGLLRCGKSCRLRWANHLRPNLKKGSFSPEEERLILELHSKLGNKWARMATQLPGRTDNEIKNYWNTRIKRRQRAGLPLYPPQIQRQTMLYRHSPEENSKFGGNVGRIPFFDPVPINFSSPPANSLFVKRATEGNLGFPVSFQVPATTTSTTPLNVVNLQVQQQPLCPFSVKMELPSSQFCPQPSGGEDPWERSNSGLLDALLGGTVANRRQAGNSSDMMISGSASENQNCVSTIPSDPKMKSEPVDHNIRSRNDDLSAFFDFMCPSQVPNESFTTTTNWCKNESGEISNGQSSGVTDDDIGLEMQQLASSLSMVPDDQTWNIPSGQWDNLPGIC